MAEAERRFSELTGAGFTAAVRRSEGRSELVRSFDPGVEETVFFPRLKAAEDVNFVLGAGFVALLILCALSVAFVLTAILGCHRLRRPAQALTASKSRELHLAQFAH
jgi:hypothetical protein